MAYSQWNSVANYLVGDIVYEGNVAYIALLANVNTLPSTAPLVWTLLVPPAPGQVDSLNGLLGNLSLVGGTGMTVAPAVPTPTDITVINNGVVSLDGQIGALITDVGQFYKNAGQTVNTTGSPQTTTVSYQTAQVWNGGAIFSVNPSLFSVGKKGIYFLEGQMTITTLAGFATTDPTWTFRCILTRGGNSNAILQTTWEQSNTTPATYAIQLSGTFQLEVGDVLSWTTQSYLSAGSYRLEAPGGAGAYDLNTFWTYQLIKPLP